jgi:hypothetical protein
MAATAESLPRSEPSRPDPQPGPSVAVEDPGSVVLRREAEAPKVESWGTSSTQAAGASRLPSVSIVIDDLGQYVVSDILGAVYGVGRSPSEALHDYHGALADRLAFLRDRRQALHPRLQRQLRKLESLFPGR